MIRKDYLSLLLYILLINLTILFFVYLYIIYSMLKNNNIKI